MSDLEVRDLTYVVGRPLLDDVSLTFRAGEVTALSGPSGSGKTTLLSVAGGLLEPTSGTTSYAGESMWRGTGDPRPEVAFVLQVYGLVPILSARENVSVALRARGVAPAEADQAADAALARFHIADLGDRQVEELSGGQMQRVACARGFVVRADILLADEPTSELDEGNRALVLTELRREAERGAVVVVATHDPAVVEACDRHYALDEGVLVAPVVEEPRGGVSKPPGGRVVPVVEEPRGGRVVPVVEEPRSGVSKPSGEQQPGRHRADDGFETSPSGSPQPKGFETSPSGSPQPPGEPASARPPDQRSPFARPEPAPDPGDS
ncbi:MAG: ATP-binding cassette domain-containing protein [Nocardioides sp.]